MDVSIVLVSYNTKDLTRDCIHSLYQRTKEVNFDIWVVDNASTDGSAGIIKKEFPHVNLIENKKNLGFGRANNLAIEKINSKYVLLLNTDTILVNNAVKILFDFMENPENKEVGACGGQLYNEDMTLQSSFGTFITLDRHFKKSFGYNIDDYKLRLKNFINNKFKSKVRQEDAIRRIEDVDFIIGADLMIKKQVLDQVGAFDNEFFMYAEEEELCFRIKKNNWDIKFVPDAKIIHLCGQSVKEQSTPINTEKMKVLGKLLFFKKCYSLKVAKLAKIFYIIYYLRYFILRCFSFKQFKRLKMILEINI